MKKEYLIILTIICCLTLFSCEDEIKIEIPNPEPKMVIHGVISPEKNIVLDVRKSISVMERNQFDWNNQHIIDAEFKLFKNNLFISNLTVDTSNNLIYKLNYNDINESETYTITGSANNYPSIIAKVNIPNKPNVTVTDFVYSKNDIYSYNTKFNINIIDNPNREDYYTLAILKRFNGIQGNEFTEQEIVKPNDPSIKYISGTYFINEKLFSGNTKTINLQFIDYAQLSQLQPTDTFWVECKIITKDYYKYLIAVNKQKINERDFYAEPVYVTNNIEGGYGLLGAYNFTRIPLILNYNGK